jgi:phosphopantetheinyl transferase
MHNGFRHLRCTVRWLTPVTARHSRTAQRSLADQIMQENGADWTLWSRSHSRGAIAVASGNPPLTRLGVDIEYTDPKRPWRDIAGAYLPDFRRESNADAPMACCLWTFGEAYFKAFGTVPPADILTGVMRTAAPDDEPVRFGARRFWYSEALPDDFWLTLVWEEEI